MTAMFAEDNRTLWQRVKRCKLYKAADDAGVTYQPGAPKTDMIPILEANNVDPLKYVQFAVHEVRDKKGNLLGREQYPVEEVHASARSGVDAQSALDERLSAKAEEEKAFEDARLDALERENAQLRRTNEQLKGVLEERLAALESDHKKPVATDSPASNYWEKYRQARDMELDVDRSMKLPQIEALIEKAQQGGESFG